MLACNAAPPAPPAWPPLGAPDARVELALLQGEWQRGDSGCTVWIDGREFRESCIPGAGALLYGDKQYLISFPQPGVIRLTEGGSYHEYGYARDGDAIYLGPGAAGRWVDGVLVVAPFRDPMLLVEQRGRCWRYDWIRHTDWVRALRADPLATPCDRRFDLLRAGDAALSPELARNRLYRM